MKKTIKTKSKPKEFITKDSGKRIVLETGAQRDTELGKSRFDLISPFFLKRLGDLLARGAEKYNEMNWVSGLNKKRVFSSALRHMMQFHMGETDEDHLAAAAFGLMVLIHYEETGREELDDLLKWK